MGSCETIEWDTGQGVRLLPNQKPKFGTNETMGQRREKIMRRMKRFFWVTLAALLAIPLFGLDGEGHAQRPFSLPRKQTLFPASRQEIVELSNGQVRIFIRPDGRFTMQTGDGRWLLYPSARTTFLTVNVDGTSYDNKNGSLEVVNPPTIQDGGNAASITYKAGEDVEVVQKFELAGQTVKFSVQVRNRGTGSHSVNVRFLLDTQIDVNDGAPLYALGVGVRTFETDIPSITFTDFFAYDQ
jgi:hypothetical protein